VSTQRPRRFWKEVAVVELPDGGYGIALDGRPVKAPSKNVLRLCSKALAEGVADEWRAQGEFLDPFSMPLTQLANTAQDRMVPLRAAIEDELLAHIDGDALCYYADGPQDLVDRQHAAWSPVTQWAAERFGVSWQQTSGIMPVSQPEPVRAAIAAALAAMSPEELAAFQVIAPGVSSLLVGLAVIHGRLNAEQAFTVSVVDELYQAEQWGHDWEADDRRERLRQELASASQFLLLARSQSGEGASDSGAAHHRCDSSQG